MMTNLGNLVFISSSRRTAKILCTVPTEVLISFYGHYSLGFQISSNWVNWMLAVLNINLVLVPTVWGRCL